MLRLTLVSVPNVNNVDFQPLATLKHVSIQNLQRRVNVTKVNLANVAAKLGVRKKQHYCVGQGSER